MSDKITKRQSIPVVVEPGSTSITGIGDSKRASFFIGETEKPLKIIGPDDEEIPLDEIIVAPDGGWGWVIVLAAFLSNVVVDGTVFSFGILISPIHEASGKTVPISTIAWVGSLAAGFYFIAGPVVSAVANRFGFRVVAVVGSFLGCLAVLASWFFCREQPVMIALFIFYGVIGGVGFGMIYVPAVIAVGFYFENKRALATGIAICGSGIGTFLFPPIMNAIMEKYNWQAALLFQGGIILFCALFGLLYRPLKPTKVMNTDRRKSTVSSLASPEGTPLLMRIKKAREMEKWDSVNSFTSNEALQEDSKLRAERLYNRARKTSTHSLGGTGGTPGAGIPQKRGSVPAMLASGDQQVPLLIPPKGKSFVGVPLSDLKEIAEEDHSEEHSRENSQPPVPSSTTILEERLEKSATDGNDNTTMRNRNNSIVLARIGSSMLTVEENSQSRILRVASKVSLTKPMYRDDIFYSGSLLRLPQYANNVNKVMTSAEWTAAVSTAPVGVSPEEEEKEASCCSPGILKKMLDFSLLVSPTFVLLAVSGFFTMLGLFVPYIYLKGVAKDKVGLDDNLATLLVSVIGIANTAGRIVAGWVADRPSINVLLLNNTSVTIIGLSTMCVPFLNSFTALFCFSCVFGLAMACYASLRSIMLVELLGLEKLTNAFGLTLLFQGIAAMLGTPLAGFLYEATGAYNIPFFVAGGFIVFSGILCYPLNYVKNWETNRENETNKAFA